MVPITMFKIFFFCQWNMFNLSNISIPMLNIVIDIDKYQYSLSVKVLIVVLYSDYMI